MQESRSNPSAGGAKKTAPPPGCVCEHLEMPTVYDEYKDTRGAWEVVNTAISDLVENRDLIEETNRYYIVGYIVKALSDADLLQPA